MILYALSGLPGSGKTTHAIKLAAELNATVHHFDDMPGANRKDTNGQAYEEFWRRIRADLSSGKTVVADGIHTSKRSREQLLTAIADIDCRKVLIVMDMPLEECLRRNANRKPRLSDFCILAVHATYEPPTLDEGWDEIKEVKNHESDFTGN